MKAKTIVMTLAALLLTIPTGCATSKAKTKKAKTEKPAKPVKLRTLIKTAKQSLKNNNNHGPAEQGLLGALPREDIHNKDRAKLYYWAALVQQNLHGTFNRTAYLKQPYDTANFFATTLAVYQRLMQCDSVDCVPNARGKVHRKYKGRIHYLVRKHRTNLLSGGVFQMRKKNYAEAYKYMDAYLSTSLNPADTLLGRISYWATLAGYNVKDPIATRKHIDAAIAFADSAQKPLLHEYKARSYTWQNDEQNWLATINEGVKTYPDHDYFFINLLDYHQTHSDYDKGLLLADSLMNAHRHNSLFWHAMGQLSLGKEDYQACIQYSDSCIRLDPNYADAYYNMALSYCNLALIADNDACKDLSNPQSELDQQRVKELYQKALPILQKLRQLQPDQPDRWATMLYRTYLKLNMGKEFDEIDKILHKQQEPTGEGK